ncbi:DsbA family protein [Candidatus Saccharibacteria bacterium]|nr:DsbA family protein [Candidatus Saccharibacteria bacterium]
MNKVTLVIIGIIVLCFGGLVTWSIISSRVDPTDFDAYDSASVIAPSASNGNIGDHVRGKTDSPVIFVEYADFQCPGCATANPSIDVIFEEYSDRVAFVFRHFPINGHQNARAAASSAIAAGLQDHFFEMVDILYSNQAVWTYSSGAERTDVFISFFKQIYPDGDVDQFKSDMGSSEVAKKISFDYDLGVKKDKVTGTPAFFVNGKYIDMSGASAAAEFQNTIRERLDAQLAKFNLPTGPAVVDEEE